MTFVEIKSNLVLRQSVRLFKFTYFDFGDRDSNLLLMFCERGEVLRFSRGRHDGKDEVLKETKTGKP